MLIAAGQRITAALLRAIYGTDWDSWTPTFTGIGSGALTSASGRWRRIGEKTVAFTVQWTVSTVGTGTTNVTWTLPTPPSRARRWMFPGGHEGGSNPRSGLYAVTFAGGTGATVDRMRYGGAVNFIGNMLENGQIYQFSGIYEEA